MKYKKTLLLLFLMTSIAASLTIFINNKPNLKAQIPGGESGCVEAAEMRLMMQIPYDQILSINHLRTFFRAFMQEMTMFEIGLIDAVNLEYDADGDNDTDKDDLSALICGLRELFFGAGEARCGDGVPRTDIYPGQQGFEQCDDGNTSNEDACLNTCIEATCGDTFAWQEFEDCDDGNNVTGDGCSGADHPNGACKVELCGDGYHDADGIPDNEGNLLWPEECDDGGICIDKNSGNPMLDDENNQITCTTLGDVNECNEQGDCIQQDNDGCDAFCELEDGYTCSGNPNVCVPLGSSSSTANSSQQTSGEASYSSSQISSQFSSTIGETTNSNTKNMNMYTNKQAFLVSDLDWRAALMLVPVSTWTGSEQSCQRGYETPGDTCIYPTVMYHETESTNYVYPQELPSSSLRMNFDGELSIFSNRNLDEACAEFDKTIVTSYVVKDKVQVGQDLEYDIVFKNCDETDFTLNNIEIIYPDPIGYTGTRNIGKDYHDFSSNPVILHPGEEHIVRAELRYRIKLPESLDYYRSSIFLKSFKPSRVALVGNTPEEITNTLTDTSAVGASLNGGQLQTINVSDYLSYWTNYNDIVYSEDNYEVSLLASTYASLINAPLIIQGTELDTSGNLDGKNIICVGTVDETSTSCSESYTLESLQTKYIEKTNTDKIIITNPVDIAEYQAAEYSDVIVLEDESQARTTIYDNFQKNSLVAPFLAAAKKEILFSTNYKNYTDVASFIKNKAQLLNNPKFLTIVSSPNIIDFVYEKVLRPALGGTRLNFSTDNVYADLNSENTYLDLIPGRILGITTSDASALVAKSLFYDQIQEKQNKIAFVGGESAICDATKMYYFSEVYKLFNYDAHYYMNKASDSGQGRVDAHEPAKDSSLIVYYGHAGPFGAIYTPSILNSPYMYITGCSTCDYLNNYDNELWCIKQMRKGAISYMGSTNFAPSVNRDKNIKNLFSNTNKTKAEMLADDRYLEDSTRVYIGDPTLNYNPPFTYNVDFSLIAEDHTNNKKTYRLKAPIIKTFVPNDTADDGICAWDEVRYFSPVIDQWSQYYQTQVDCIPGYELESPANAATVVQERGGCKLNIKMLIDDYSHLEFDTIEYIEKDFVFRITE